MASSHRCETGKPASSETGATTERPPWEPPQLLHALVYVRLRGEPYLLWRAVDQHGAELDVLLQKRRDKAAAKRFFRRVLRSNPLPRMIVTEQLRSSPAAKADIPDELAQVKHVFVKAAARVRRE